MTRPLGHLRGKEIPLSPGWVWGIDTGSLRAGFGFASEEGDALHTDVVEWRWPKDKTDLGPSLKACYSEVYNRAVTMKHQFPPATICVEQATGRTPNPSLMYHGGVIVLAVAQAVGISPWLMVVPAWKRVHREDGTNLNAKEDLMPWGASIGLLTEDEERLAGAAVALAARKVWNGRSTLDLGRPWLADAA